MLKKLFIGVLAVVLLLVVAGVALIAFVDVNRFKPQMASYVQQQYDRTLVIDGDLGLSLWPDIAVSLPAMRLSEPQQADAIAMKLNDARVSVRLMPLLSGKLQADVIRVSGLDATIVRRADGSLSIDDLIGAPADDANAAAAPAADAAAGTGVSPVALGDIELGGLELLDARVVFDDRQAGNRIELANLNLVTGELADGRETPVDLSVDATMSNPKLDVNAVLESRLAIGFATGQVNAATLALQVKGTFDNMPLNQTVTASDLVASADAVRAARLALAGNIVQGERKMAYEIGSPFAMNLQDGSMALDRLAGEFRLDDKAIATEPLVVPIAGSVQANTMKETAKLVLDLAARDMTLNASVDVKGFAKPAIAFDVRADRIDVDRFLPPAAPEPSGAPAPPPPGSGAEAPIDLTVLDTLDLDGRLRVGELIASGATVRELDLSVKAKGGKATVAPITARLYEGVLNGRASLASAGNRITLATDLTGIQIGPLLTDLADTDLLTGKGNVSLDVRTDGATVTALKRSLDGKASLSLADGAIKGINLGERIRDVRRLLGAGKNETVASNDQVRTDFSALTASFAIVDGVATNTDLDGKTPLLRLSGGGKVDIGQSTLDYLAKAAVVGTSKGQGGREVEELRGVTIPVRLTGRFDELAWAIDWSVAAKEALKSRAAEQLGVDQATIDAKKAELKAKADAEEAKLRAELQARTAEEEARLREQLKQKEQELKDKAAEKLKGLFN